MTGVYQILCASNGRRYIGSASNIAQRWRCHRTQLRANKHRNAKLQRAWNKYGEDAFEFSKLIECEVTELLNIQSPGFLTRISSQIAAAMPDEALLRIACGGSFGNPFVQRE